MHKEAETDKAQDPVRPPYRVSYQRSDSSCHDGQWSIYERVLLTAQPVRKDVGTGDAYYRERTFNR